MWPYLSTARLCYSVLPPRDFCALLHSWRPADCIVECCLFWLTDWLSATRDIPKHLFGLCGISSSHKYFPSIIFHVSCLSITHATHVPYKGWWTQSFHFFLFLDTCLFISRHPSISPVLEPTPFSDHILHRLCLLKFFQARGLLHDASACSPPLLLVFV